MLEGLVTISYSTATRFPTETNLCWWGKNTCIVAYLRGLAALRPKFSFFSKLSRGSQPDELQEPHRQKSWINKMKYFLCIWWFYVSVHPATVSYFQLAMLLLLKRHLLWVFCACHSPKCQCLQATCASRTSDLRELRCGYPCNSATKVVKVR
jgi:hypothetical protein